MLPYDRRRISPCSFVIVPAWLESGLYAKPPFSDAGMVARWGSFVLGIFWTRLMKSCAAFQSRSAFLSPLLRRSSTFWVRRMAS